MNKITFPRVGYDGKEYSKKKIEKWYVEQVKNKIIDNLTNNITDGLINSIVTKETDNKKVKNLIEDLKNPPIIEKILLYTPDELEKHKGDYCIINQYAKLKTAIANAFNYKEFRKKELVELAKRLNVKVCPYCNMHYTLFAEKKDGKHKVKQLAKFQFDHFVNKNDYPMFSMSLYNLIPSCAVCNQGKHKGELPLALNPYSNDIYKLFHFEVKEPLPLLMGKKEEDKTEIDVVCNDIKNSKDVKTYDKTFHISALYSRHKDVVQEIFDKTYIASSARDIAKMLMQNKNNLSKEERIVAEAIDKIEGYGGRYISELWYGTYLDEEDIEKRPLSKFIQDIKKQSESIF